MKIKINLPKPRNSLVPLSMNLKAGTHEKTEKSLRNKIKISLKKETNKQFDK